MGKTTRWIAIIASIFMACAALSASPAKKKARHHVRHTRTRHYSRRHHYRRHHYYRRRVRLPKHPSRERTKQIQTALARGGYYKDDPNGRWNSSTVTAVRKFQAAHNMDATGKLDAPTLQKLGLGSDIAGVAAPRPMVPKNCCSVGPTAAAPAKLATPSTGPAPKSAAPASDKTKAARASAASIVPAAKGNGTTDSASASKPTAAQH